jgi:alkylation response protein AidB-like acyl-CoA dehydrogenase
MRLFSEHHELTLNQDERAWLDKARTLCRETLGPRAAQVGRQDVFAWDNFRLLCDAGIVGTAFPRAYGGTQARMQLRIRLIEELGRVCSASASIVTGTDLSTRAIVAGATDAMKQELLPGLCTGRLQAAFALTEPGAGSDVRGVATTAVPQGDGYVVNGRKKFITRADTADWLVVVGRLPGHPAASDMVALLVPAGAPGVRISAPNAKLGWFGVPICEIAFTDVRVPAAWRLGAEGDGFALGQDALVRARIGHAAMALGRAIGAVEIAAAYCNDRELFGERLGAKQGVQWMLADMATQIAAARLLVYKAAAGAGDGFPDPTEAAQAKIFTSEMAIKVTNDALQLFGAAGYSRNRPLERMVRDARMFTIGGGTAQILRTVVASRLLGRRLPQTRDGYLNAMSRE